MECIEGSKIITRSNVVGLSRNKRFIELDSDSHLLSLKGEICRLVK